MPRIQSSKKTQDKKVLLVKKPEKNIKANKLNKKRITLNSSLLSRFVLTLQLLRPKQWIKNISVFIPIFFNGSILTAYYMTPIIYAFVSLCLLSSAVYVINDVIDSSRDALHPVKRNRPIASGNISKPSAIILSIGLLIASIWGGFLFISSEYFVVLQLGYFVMMLVYSVWLKNVAIIDTIIIALGFVFRVLAGAIIVEVPMSAMLTVAIIGGALFISFGKRRTELTNSQGVDIFKHRPSLSSYPVGLLDSVLTALFAVTFMSYVMFAYGFAAFSIDSKVLALLPPLLRNSPLLLLTVPIAFYVLVRYMILVYGGKYAGEPEKIWFKDRGLIVSILIWAISLFMILYFEQILQFFGLK